jgi:hypothetical protein
VAATGGGLSGIALGGIIGGAAAGGILGARALLSDDSDVQLPLSVSGTFAAQTSITASLPGFPNCAVPYSESGTIQVTLDKKSGDTFSGTITLGPQTQSIAQSVCVFGGTVLNTGSQISLFPISGAISGTAANLLSDFGITQGSDQFVLSGAIQDRRIVGTYTHTKTPTPGSGFGGNGGIQASLTAVSSVTLQ